MIAEINDPNGRIQQFIASQGDNALRVSLTALGVLLPGPVGRCCSPSTSSPTGPACAASICSRLRPARQLQVLSAWELAIDKTGGYLYSRALLAGLSAVFHWIVFQALGTQAPVALALWVGLISQFLPVVGTYLAGVLPVLLTLIDSPVKALIIAIFILLYQQIENYLFAPRITARTMELHPALAFGVGARRRCRARRGRRHPGVAGGGDDPGAAQQRRSALRGHRQPPHARARPTRTSDATSRAPLVTRPPRRADPE